MTLQIISTKCPVMNEDVAETIRGMCDGSKEYEKRRFLAVSVSISNRNPQNPPNLEILVGIETSGSIPKVTGVICPEYLEDGKCWYTEEKCIYAEGFKKI